MNKRFVPNCPSSFGHSVAVTGEFVCKTWCRFPMLPVVAWTEMGWHQIRYNSVWAFELSGTRTEILTIDQCLDSCINTYYKYLSSCHWMCWIMNTRTHRTPATLAALEAKLRAFICAAFMRIRIANNDTIIVAEVRPHSSESSGEQ